MYSRSFAEPANSGLLALALRRSLKNLELQHWESEDGAKKKDRLERPLQRLVCAGAEPLADAQRAIYLDWKDGDRRYIEGPR